MYKTTELYPGTFAIEEDHVRMYLITGSKRAVLLDTGFGTGDLKSCVSGLTALPVCVWHTHGHMDHAGADEQFGEVWIHPGDKGMIAGMMPELVIRDLEDGRTIDLGGRKLMARHTPGHTAGSVSVLDPENKVIFSGDNVSDDTVFLFNGADLDAYEETLRWLLAQQGTYDDIYGCHGSVKNPYGRVERQLTCVQKARRGELPFEEVEIFDGKKVLIARYEEVSIFLPLDFTPDRA